MAVRQARAPAPKGRLKRGIQYLVREYDLYLMLIPMLLFYILFAYKPMTGLVIAFKDYSPFKGVWDSPWVGFQYFEEFFTSQFAWRVIRNTLTISLTSLVFGFPAPIILAVLLNELRELFGGGAAVLERPAAMTLSISWRRQRTLSPFTR